MGTGMLNSIILLYKNKFKIKKSTCLENRFSLQLDIDVKRQKHFCGKKINHQKGFKDNRSFILEQKTYKCGIQHPI